MHSCSVEDQPHLSPGEVPTLWTALHVEPLTCAKVGSCSSRKRAHSVTKLGHGPLVSQGSGWHPPSAPQGSQKNGCIRQGNPFSSSVHGQDGPYYPKMFVHFELSEEGRATWHQGKAWLVPLLPSPLFPGSLHVITCLL